MEAGQAGSPGDGQSEARVLWALSASSSLSTTFQLAGRLKNVSKAGRQRGHLAMGSWGGCMVEHWNI